MNGENGNPARIPLHIEMQTQQIHRRLGRRVRRQMADVRMAQRTTDINDLDIVFPFPNRTLVEDRTDDEDDEEGPYGVRVQDFRNFRGRDPRGRRYGVADGGGADYDVYFPGRADDGVHGGAVGDGRGVYGDV